MILVSVPLIVAPEPLFGIPVTFTVLFLVHVNVVPGVVLVSEIGLIATPEHTVCEPGVATAVGVGFTNTVAVIGVPVQPLAVGVIVKVTVIGNAVVLVSVPEMFPEPLAAIPVTVATLSLVQLNVVAGTDPVSAIVVIATPEQLV